MELQVPRTGAGACYVLGPFAEVVSMPRSVRSVPAAVASSPGPEQRNLFDLIRASNTLRRLGTLQTAQGQLLFDCRLLSTMPDGVVVLHSLGLAKILNSEITPAMQRALAGH